MRTHLKIQEEKRVQDEQKLVQMDREYGQKVDQELSRNQAMASIYPPIQTIPSDQALSLKRQKQLEYNRQLEAQVEAKQDKLLQDHLQLQEESRKNQQDYIDKVQSKLDQEQKHRLEGNIKCIAMCDTLKKVKDIQSQVEKDNDEFGY